MMPTASLETPMTLRSTPTSWKKPVPCNSPAPLRSQSVPSAVWQWLSAALDELDYGILLLFEGMRVVHINDAAPGTWRRATRPWSRRAAGSGTC